MPPCATRTTATPPATASAPPKPWPQANESSTLLPTPSLPPTPLLTAPAPLRSRKHQNPRRLLGHQPRPTVFTKLPSPPVHPPSHPPHNPDPHPSRCTKLYPHHTAPPPTPHPPVGALILPPPNLNSRPDHPQGVCPAQHPTEADHHTHALCRPSSRKTIFSITIPRGDPARPPITPYPNSLHTHSSTPVPPASPPHPPPACLTPIQNQRPLLRIPRSQVMLRPAYSGERRVCVDPRRRPLLSSVVVPYTCTCYLSDRHR